MSLQDQQDIKEKYYNEAIRYMDNAKEDLKSAKKEGGFYYDKKYVKRACGTAYSGVLVALDCFVQLNSGKKISGKDRKSIDFYRGHITAINRKMLGQLNSAYEILHLWGYYDGITNAKTVKDGFDLAYALIETIKPS
jgi:hypothetical protein